MHSFKAAAITAFGSITMIGSPAAQVSIGAGAELTSGNYGGTESTETLYVPFILKYETGPWLLKATVPYLRISGPANVIGAGADRITLPGARAQRRTESGLGDVMLSAFNTVMNERRDAFGLDLGGKVKLPTADEQRGLGTGETDYAVQADVFKPFGNLTAFGSLGYRIYGDPPGLTLRNVPYYAIGASYRMAPEGTVGVAYDYRPRIITGGSEISEATLFWSRRLSRQWRQQLYGVAGFGNGSPDAGLGAIMEYRY
jgi:hypothetical protein